MKCNVGKGDRIFRFILAVILIAAGVVLKLTETAGLVLVILLIVFGAIMLITALVKFCPLYIPFKIDTGKNK